MHLKKLAIAGVLLTALSGCLDNDLERGVAGAAAGAVVADATGGSGTTGAIVGGAAGVFCDDVGICR